MPRATRKKEEARSQHNQKKVTRGVKHTKVQLYTHCRSAIEYVRNLDSFVKRYTITYPYTAHACPLLQHESSFHPWYVPDERAVKKIQRYTFNGIHYEKSERGSEAKKKTQHSYYVRYFKLCSMPYTLPQTSWGYLLHWLT